MQSGTKERSCNFRDELWLNVLHLLKDTVPNCVSIQPKHNYLGASGRKVQHLVLRAGYIERWSWFIRAGMDELTKTKRVRSGHQGLATKLVAKMNERKSNATDDSAGDSFFKQSKIKLSEKLELLKRMDKKVIELISANEDENA